MAELDKEDGVVNEPLVVSSVASESFVLPNFPSPRDPI